MKPGLLIGGFLAVIALAFLPFLEDAGSAIEAADQRATPIASSDACDVQVSAHVAPPVLTICAHQESTIVVRPTCSVCPGGIRVVYLIPKFSPNSNWVRAETLRSLKSLEGYAGGAKIEAAVVEIDLVTPKVLQGFTVDLTQVDAVLRRSPSELDIVMSGEVDAARLAATLVEASRTESNLMPLAPCEFAVIFAAGKVEPGKQSTEVVGAAALLHKRLNIDVMVGCPEVSRWCKDSRQAPIPARYYTEYPDRELERYFQEKLSHFEVGTVTIDQLDVTQHLPPGLAYVEGSANPPPSSLSVDGLGTTVGWAWPDQTAPAGSITITYQVQPLQAGQWSIEGEVNLTDTVKRTQKLPVPSQPVTVTQLVCNPSPTPPPTTPASPTPTSSGTPTETPVPTSTPTPVPTGTPKPGPIYLPIIVSESCAKQSVYADVALVIDVSTSMNQLTRSGRTKLTATQSAATEFVALMDFTPDTNGKHDQVAVVGFNHRAWTEQSLSSDDNAIRRSIANVALGQAEGTRLDLAFQEGQVALTSHARLLGNSPVIILLTDGLPNGVPVAADGTVQTTVLAAARAAKATGTQVYTIGVGEPNDVDGALLAACAGGRQMYHYAPDAEDLAGIYRQIAYEVGCPADRFWGGR